MFKKSKFDANYKDTNPRSSMNVKDKEKENHNKVHQNQIPENQQKNQTFFKVAQGKETHYILRKKYRNVSRCLFRKYASQKTINTMKMLKEKK